MLLAFAGCGPTPSIDAGAHAGQVEDAGVSDAGTGGCTTSCDDSNPCTADSCVSSACEHAPLSGASCDDGSALTSGDECTGAGACVGTPIVCPADTACITYTPNGTSTCAAEIHVTATCDDEDLSTSGDRCDVAGGCGGTPVVCPADTACVTYAPDGSPSCGSTILSGAVCDDSDLATHTDRCGVTGVCAGTPVTCPANDSCSTWTPNGTASCSVTRHDGAACDDQDACTPTGSCSAGTCVVGPAVTCLNGGTCVAGGCSCTAGWTGPTCATDLDECATGACGGGSICMNSPGSYGCQCVTNYSSPTGANCTSTTRALELAVFYDEGAARKYGPDAEARIASIIARTKALYDTGLSSPALTLSVNAIIRIAPLPSAIVKRSCATTPPGRTCVGCYSDNTCTSLVSSLANEVDTSLLLQSFQTYANTARRTAVNAVSGGFDVSLLITDADFAANTVGLAGVGVACSTTNGAGMVSTATNPTDQTLAITIAHELGHTLGMQHDVNGSFIMSASTSMSASSFSPESLTAYRNYVTASGACLAAGAPDNWVAHQCGNGVIKGAETCDPNVATDTCCSATCQLNAGCLCGNSEPCCANGAPRDAGTVCSASRGECDLADTCDGQSGACGDRYLSPRTACSNAGYCLRGQCASRTLVCSTTIQSPPYNTYTGCDTSTRCDRTDCNASPGSCNAWFITPAKDGTICGATNQCIAGLCVPSASLKDYEWVSGGWSACTQGTSTRTISCVDELGTAALASLCDPSTAPLTTRSCTP